MASPAREVWGDLATSAFVEASLLFKSLDAEARSDLVKLARAITWQAGEVVSAEGDETFTLVLDGVGSVRVGSPDGAVEVAHLDRGGYHGGAALVGSTRAWSLVALTDLSGVVFPLPMIAALLERYPKVKKLLEVVQAAREKEAAEKLGG
jgi:CRP-like cAMP-binding protein